MIRVKVCGITRVDDALLAASLGAYAIGFIFWPGSKRFIAADAAAGIALALPETVMKVGVFVDQPASHVTELVRTVGLDVVQLHGGESVAFARALGYPVIKAVPVDAGIEPTAVDLPTDITPLLDAHDPVRRGGTGRTIDWSVAARVAARRPIILSGGLHAGNIREAIDTVRPFAVDLSSGVEQIPGVKDAGKLRALFEAIQHD